MALPIGSSRLLIFIFITFLVFHVEGKRIIRTVAGIPPFAGDGKLATNAFLSSVKGVFAFMNDIYFADSDNHIIRKIDKHGIISTVVGIPGKNGYDGDGGLATEAKLYNPRSVFVTPEREMYIADLQNSAIRKVSSGIITTIAGGPNNRQDSTIAVNASMEYPSSVFVKNDEVYVCDSFAVRKILTNGSIITVAGILHTPGAPIEGVLATESPFLSTTSVYVTDSNEMYISDENGRLVRKVFSNGTITTVAGKLFGNCNPTKHDPDLATNVALCDPTGIFVSPVNELFIADSLDCMVKKVLSNGTMVTIFGTSHCGIGRNFIPANETVLFAVNSISMSSSGEFLIAEDYSNLIRKVGTDGIIRPVAGVIINDDPQLQTMQLKHPRSVYVTKSNDAYIADTANYQIKKLLSNGSISIFAGTNTEIKYNGENIPATQAVLGLVSDISMNEAAGDLYFADISFNLVRKVDSNGIIRHVMGIGPWSRHEIPLSDGFHLANNTLLVKPTGVFYHSDSNCLFITDNQIIRKVFLENGTTTIVAGNSSSYGKEETGDGGLAIHANLMNPQRVYVTKDGELYIASNSIRKVFANGTITTLFTGDYNTFKSVTVDEDTGEMYATFNPAILKGASNGTIEIFAGDANASIVSKSAFYGDDRPPLECGFSNPEVLFLSNSKALYIVDKMNNVIRKITNLCEDYFWTSDLQIQQIISTPYYNFNTLNRKICSNSDFFVAEFLPILILEYESNGEEFKSFVIQNWNAPQQITADMSDQLLDTILVTLDGCDDRYYAGKNCSTYQQMAIVPTASPSNFLIFPSLTSVTFINYFRKSNAVLSLAIQATFLNLNTNKVDAAIIVNSATSTTEITGLSYSTTYCINISTAVIYNNGMQRSSIPSFIKIQTLPAILPSATVNDIETIVQNNLILLTWNAMDMQKTGNLPVERLELQLSYTRRKIQFIQNVTIPYNPSTNEPSSYSVKNLLPDIYYQFRLKVCSSAGCGPLSEPVTDIIRDQTDISLLAVVLILSLIILGMIFATVVVFGFVIIGAIYIWRCKKFSKGNPSSINAFELIEKMVSKEFRIEESKLDFTDSKMIGSGANGSVFTAKYFNMDVAVKMIKKTSLGVENDLTEFYNELKFLNSNTQHMNLIRFFGVYDSVSKDSVGLVMEYCPNGTVANYIMRRELSLQEKIDLFQGIANGMQYLHFHNIAHRDLKCENVLLDVHMVPKIIDFGYSREINENTNQSLHLTMNVGTAVYCAPEVIKNQLVSSLSQRADSFSSNSFDISKENNLSEPLIEKDASATGSLIVTKEQRKTKLAYDKKCDVYSFGIMIYVIYFRNKQPYGNVSDNQILFHLSKNPEFRPRFNEDLIPEQEKWIIELMRQCWKTDSSERPSFDQICAVLQSHSG